MATPKQQLAKLEKLSSAHRVAVFKAQQIQEQRDNLIIEMLDEGKVTSSVIATSAGTSQPRIIQIRTRKRLKEAVATPAVEVTDEPVLEAATA